MLIIALVGGVLRDHKLFQMLDPSDKIEEITEEVSDIKEFDQSSRLFCIKTYLDPDFHQDQAKPQKTDVGYYSSLVNTRDSEIRKKKIFYKAFNIGLGLDKELSINMVFNVFICSNETIRVSLQLNDMYEKNKVPPVHHLVNFSKNSFRNCSKLYSELVRYKEFFFVMQIEFCTLNNYQNTAFNITLF